MGKQARLLLVLSLVLVLVSGLGWQRTFAQSSDEEYFDQTGHRVSGPFLAAYRSAANPLLIYGYPITEAFQDPTTGALVQYFQKARFELRPGATDAQVTYTPLGEYLYQPGQPPALSNSSPTCRAFPPRDLQVCYAFLDFYDANGGFQQFGLPVSNAEQHKDRIVQYFQRARFEWHPEMPAGQRVILSDLGTLYFDARGENPARLLPNPGSNTINSVLDLKARAYPQKAVTSRSGLQTVYVIVQDQRLLPVENVQVTLMVTYPSGEQSRYIIPTLTNARGMTRFTFPFQSDLTGTVRILVTANQQNLQNQTTTSFRLWW